MLNPGIKDTIVNTVSVTDAALSNGTQKTKVVDALGNTVDTLTDEQGHISLRTNIIQDVHVVPGNSSTANLASGATFTGTGVSTLGVVGIQVSLKTDVNCTVYIDQSPDNVNWDLSDTYTYTNYNNNFGITAQAINSYFRVRVTNTSGVTSTFFRLQSVLCPTVEALPRSLDIDGNLKVGIKSVTDQYGFVAENTPYGEAKSIEPVKLVGATFVGSTIDTNFWISTVANGGTNTQVDGQLLMRTNTTANGSAIMRSNRTARYLSGAGNRFRATVRLATSGTTNNVRRWGVADTAATNGAFFELNGTTLRIVTRKNGVDTAVSSFNGNLGSTITLDNNIQAYEIYYTLTHLYFTYNDKLLHTITASTTTWSSTPNLGVFLENTNSAGSTTDVQMEVRIANIYRMGKLSTSPTRYHTTAAGTYTLKIGAGLLHAININSAGAPASSLTIYDNTSGTGSVIGVIDASKIPSPMPIPYNGGVNFDIGLTLVQVGTFDTTIIYE